MHLHALFSYTDIETCYWVHVGRLYRVRRVIVRCVPRVWLSVAVHFNTNLENSRFIYYFRTNCGRSPRNDPERTTYLVVELVSSPFCGSIALKTSHSTRFIRPPSTTTAKKKDPIMIVFKRKGYGGLLARVGKLGTVGGETGWQ